MRLNPEVHAFIKDTAGRMFPGAALFLFGSRVDDQAKGGDIDLMIVSEEKLHASKIRAFRIAFIKRFGWQKLDIVNYTTDENPPFRQLISDTSILL